MDPVTLALVTAAASAGANKLFSSFGGGTEDQHQQRSRLNPKQRKLEKQLVDAGLGQGAGGAFGDAADYYRSNLSNNPEDFNAMAAPDIRNFNENIIPGLSEQFAGMGAGGLSSSGFRNAAVGAGTDLSERLGAIRANLRANSAAGLTGIGTAGLGDFTNNTYTQGAPGFMETGAPGLANLAVQAGSHYFQNQGGAPNAAPTPNASQMPASPQFTGSQNLPNFNPSTRQGAFGSPPSTKGRASPYGQGKLQMPSFMGA